MTRWLARGTLIAGARGPELLVMSHTLPSDLGRPETR